MVVSVSSNIAAKMLLMSFAPQAEGRLLYLGQNEWAHVNCCIWSAEVYEDNSALLQVHSAVSRGRYLVRKLPCRRRVLFRSLTIMDRFGFF